MHNKYFSEHTYYFIIFIILSLFYILNGYASLATNDDWALRGMLVAKDIYGTLIMSYPLSYVISHLYDIFPTYQWYSILLTLFMAINFYLIACYIEKLDSYIQKAILLILALLWMTFLWFNMSITILTMTTMVSAIGLINKNLYLSFLLIALASLLRIDIVLMLIPYYGVSFFILREPLFLKKKEIMAFLGVIIVITASLYLQKKDHLYNDWLAFNKARSSIVDMGMMDVKENYFTPYELFCIQAGWWQDTDLLSTKKIISTTPKLSAILQKNIQKIHLIDFINAYKFKHWLWLLLLASTLVIIFNIKSKKIFFIPLLAIGVILLLITRDVERVTVPLILLWAYVIFETLKPYRMVNTVFLAIFTYIFYYYSSGQLGYRYFKENTRLQQEAHQLISQSNKICETSINFPTVFSNNLNTVFKANYLFHENNWLQLNNKEILPTGWLSRHEFFYKTHDISDKETTRKYHNYHEYLIDDKTAFFGSNQLIQDKTFDIYLLAVYDKLYLKDRPECKHKTFIIKKSKHFAISQIRVDCNSSKDKADQSSLKKED